MSDTKLEAVLDAMATAFAAIDGTGSFETTVQTVNQRPTNHATTVKGNAPSIDITAAKITRPGEARPQFNAEVRSAEIQIYGYRPLARIAGTSNFEAPHKAWLPLYRDVERVADANRTWGGYAINTTFVSCEPEYAREEVAFVATLRVDYLFPRA